MAATVERLKPKRSTGRWWTTLTRPVMTSRARPAIALLVLSITATQAARAQAERKALSGADVAVFNIAGKVEVVAGTGSDVVVEVTRRGRDASRLRVEVGEIRGHNTLRVVYPDDDVVYDDMDRWGNTEFRINADGTWNNSHDDRDDDRGSRGSGHRIRIKSSGSGTHAWADLRVLVPSGKHAGVYLGVGGLSANRRDVRSAPRGNVGAHPDGGHQGQSRHRGRFGWRRHP